MSKLSKKREERIKQDILSLLFERSPTALLTYSISEELCRDDEFTRRLLVELKSKGLVNEIKKSSKGEEYTRWRKWKLTNQAYKAYKQVSQ